MTVLVMFIDVNPPQKHKTLSTELFMVCHGYRNELFYAAWLNSCLGCLL